MIRIKKIGVYKIYSGDGRPAVFIKLRLSNGREVSVSNVLPQIGDDQRSFSVLNEKINTEVAPFFYDLELGDDAALTVDRWLLEWQAHDKTLMALSWALSVAVNRLMASVNEQELYRQLSLTYGFAEEIYDFPTPLINLFNGGRHADTNLDFEEFLLVPLSKNKTSLSEKITAASRVFLNLADSLRQGGLDSDIGGFGGYAPDMHSSVDAFSLIWEACRLANLEIGRDVGIGVNVGAQYLSAGHGKYLFQLDNSRLQSMSLVDLYEDWERRYGLVYLEDPLAPSDIAGWKKLTLADSSNLTLAGNYFFDNSQLKFRQNLKNHLANAIVVKPSAMSVVSEAVDLVKLAQGHGYQVVLSADDQETADTFLADLCLAVNADFIKSGSVARAERNNKLNRLLEVEQDLAL